MGFYVVLAHWFVLSLSVRLVRDPILPPRSLGELFSRVVMSFVVALIASSAVLLTPTIVAASAARISGGPGSATGSRR